MNFFDCGEIVEGWLTELAYQSFEFSSTTVRILKFRSQEGSDSLLERLGEMIIILFTRFGLVTISIHIKENVKARLSNYLHVQLDIYGCVIIIVMLVLRGFLLRHGSTRDQKPRRIS